MLWIWLGALGCNGGCTSSSVPEKHSETSEPIDTAEPIDPGAKSLHRLNRVEYNNTVRDLLGTALRPADDFPPDDHGHGFDNMASVLAASPVLVELWELAAQEIATEALYLPPQEPWDWTWAWDDTDLVYSGGVEHNDGHAFWSVGDASWMVDIPESGTWTFTLEASGNQEADEWVLFEVTVDGRSEGQVAVEVELPAIETVSIDVPISAGEHTLGVGFINDYYVENVADRNAWLASIQLSGPVGFEPEVNATREEILLCEPSSEASALCLQNILSTLASRVYRRPATEEEVTRLATLVEVALSEGDEFDKGVELALQAMLLSPSFLFRPELDPVPENGETRELDAWELAARLSYFLWSSMPDETLFTLAASGELLKDDVLEEQTRRMLADPKAQALVDNFAGQWLYIRAIENARPDPWVYPDFDSDLQESMKDEMALVFGAMIVQDRDLRDLLLANDTYVDERLAQHYGLEGVDGPRWIDVSSIGRGGLLTQAGLLMALSHPNRTSPVKRGKWILEQLLCAPQPTAPPDVDAFNPSVDAEASLRDQMEQHRSDPTCAACHQLMDPLGFGLDHFDGIGGWRTVDEYGFAVDASGELPSGRNFYGVAELTGLLVTDPRYPKCIAEQGLTYALGRGLTQADDNTLIDEVTTSFTNAGWRFSDLVVAIVQSSTFRSRSAH